MRTKIQPGKYLSGFLGRDGNNETLCRCPVCWHEWFINTESHLEVMSQIPVWLECLCCNQTKEYYCAESQTKGEASSLETLPYVSRKRKKPDSTVSGGLFPGFDVRLGRIADDGRG